MAEQGFHDTLQEINSSMGLSLSQTDCLMKHLDSLAQQSAKASIASSAGRCVPQQSIKEEDVAKRSEGLSTVFSSQQELNFYRFCREANLSHFMEDRLFRMVTSVSASSSLNVWKSTPRVYCVKVVQFHNVYNLCTRFHSMFG
jgi:hypothetical protein